MQAVMTISDKEQGLRNLRLPKAVQAVFLAPLKRTPTHGIPVCDLQIRSYSVRNLEVFADFCMRAAYYLNLPAKGPVTLPRITERWTVPKAHFIFKKQQENFERKTLRRLIQIQDGHPETVAIWLAYIQKHRYYGVGLKANVFEQGSMDTVKDLEAEGTRIQNVLGESVKLEQFGEDVKFGGSGDEFDQLIHTEHFKAQWGALGPMSGLANDPRGVKNFQWERLTTPKRKDQSIKYPDQKRGARAQRST